MQQSSNTFQRKCSMQAAIFYQYFAQKSAWKVLVAVLQTSNTFLQYQQNSPPMQKAEIVKAEIGFLQYFAQKSISIEKDQLLVKLARKEVSWKGSAVSLKMKLRESFLN